MYSLKESVIEQINGFFAKYAQISKAMLYGSRAKGNFRDGSDIDLALQGEELTLSVLFRIEKDLDDLLLPYKIDLSILHQIENPDLVAHIERVGRLFYQKAVKHTPAY